MKIFIVSVSIFISGKRSIRLSAAYYFLVSGYQKKYSEALEVYKNIQIYFFYRYMYYF